MKICLAWLLLPGFVFAQDDMWDDDDWGDDEQGSVWSGFLEAAAGTRIDDDSLVPNRSTLQDVRARFESEWQPGSVRLGLKADLGYDGIENEWITKLREASVSFSIGAHIDASIGRQVQTWGSGDLLFLNDLFPKDFVSFFAGRDDEYLKAPGNALRLTRYSDAVNIDVVWTPVFEPNVYLTGERFSFFSPIAGAAVAPDPHISAAEPEHDVENGEFAVRLFRTAQGREYALYAYRGFFKDPSAMTPQFQAIFSAMQSIGGSLRQSAGPGLFNAEFSYYDSRDDDNGTNPLVPNDQLRVLAGYEWEAKPRFTVSLQYYLEWTLDHDELLANSLAPHFEPDEYRHVLTNRLTYRSARDEFTWSLFTFYAPGDKDFYLRPSLHYRHSDQWSLSVGANILGGSDAHTFFSQLSDGSNAYLRVRYNY